MSYKRGVRTYQAHRAELFDKQELLDQLNQRILYLAYWDLDMIYLLNATKSGSESVDSTRLFCECVLGVSTSKESSRNVQSSTKLSLFSMWNT